MYSICHELYRFVQHINYNYYRCFTIFSSITCLYDSHHLVPQQLEVEEVLEALALCNTVRLDIFLLTSLVWWGRQMSLHLYHVVASGE